MDGTVIKSEGSVVKIVLGFLDLYSIKIYNSPHVYSLSIRPYHNLRLAAAAVVAVVFPF